MMENTIEIIKLLLKYANENHSNLKDDNLAINIDLFKFSELDKSNFKEYLKSDRLSFKTITIDIRLIDTDKI